VVHRWVIEGLRALRGIEPYEVMQALSAPRRLPVAARSGGIPVLTIWARTNAGRPLIVVLRKSGWLDQDIIGAPGNERRRAGAVRAWETTSDE
jgi:hypothetical protein